MRLADEVCAHVKFTRIALFSVWVAVAAMLAANAVASSERIPFSKRQKIGPAVVDNTLLVFPQISPTLDHEAIEPENPTPPIHHPRAYNNLPIGGIVGQERGKLVPTPLFPGLAGTHTWVPPDITIAVGTTHIVTTVNSTIGFYRKDGTQTFQQDMLGSSGFFGSVGAGDFVFDPKVFFDPISSRFFVIALDGAGPDSFADIAVSSGPDPNGTWFKYRIHLLITDSAGTFWFDYPGWGFNKDAILLTGNMFSTGAGGFHEVQMLVLPKAPLLTGGAATTTQFLDPNAFTVQPAQTNDSSEDTLFAAETFDNSSAMQVYAFTNLTATPTLTKTSIAIPTWDVTNTAALSQNGFMLDTVPARLKTCVYRNGSLFTTHGVSVANDTNGRMSVRWYEIGTNGFPAGTPTLNQTGEVAHPGGSTLMGAMNANKAGDVSLMYTRCSPTITADLVFTVHKHKDPAGVMGSPKFVKSSEGNRYNTVVQSGLETQRWGDYFAVCIDPVDDATFWGVGMYGNSGGDDWKTWIQKWVIATPHPTPPQAANVFTGQSGSGDQSTVADADGNYFTVSSIGTTVGAVAAIEADFQLHDPALQAGVWDITTLDSLTVTIVANAPRGNTNMVHLYNWITGKWDLVKANPHSGADLTISFDITNFSAYVDSTGQVKVLERAIAPQRLGARPFTLSGDQILLTPAYND